MDGVTLLSNASATGSDKIFKGGRGVCVFTGTVGGATIKLQLKVQDGTYIDLNTFSAAGQFAFDAAPGLYRISVSGGTPSALYADLFKVY